MRAGPRAALAVVVAGAAALAAGILHAHAAPAPPVRVTVFGDSSAAAIAYDPDAKRALGRGIDLRLEVAVCRRLGDTSCPYEGVRPPNVIDRATQLGGELGPIVVVDVGYNDYEANYAENIDGAMAAFRKAGVQRVLWLTLRAGRQSYSDMNGMIVAAAKRYPEITVLDWDGLVRQHADWLQSDEIHLTAAGAEGMATMIEDSLIGLGIVPSPAPPSTRRLLAIASRTLPAARVGRRYAARLQAVGGRAPYRWRRTAGTLAPGLRLAASGRVTGVPRRTGTFRLRVRVVDRTGTARVRLFSVRVR